MGNDWECNMHPSEYAMHRYYYLLLLFWSYASALIIICLDLETSSTHTHSPLRLNLNKEWTIWTQRIQCPVFCAHPACMLDRWSWKKGLTTFTISQVTCNRYNFMCNCMLLCIYYLFRRLSRTIFTQFTSKLQTPNK